MEAMLRKQSNTPLQKFLLAKIGYGKGGAIDALSNSVAGLRFLCFASALVGSCSNFDAANTLAVMIHDSAEEKSLTPTVFQLKDLLDVLEPSLNRSRFLDEVHGYQVLIDPWQGRPTEGIAVPSSSAIKAISESFRELYRVGSADAQSIRFTVGPFAAWVSAFARMCVEVPPFLSDEQGHSIVDQQASLVTICVSKDTKYRDEVEIEIVYAYGSSEKFTRSVIAADERPALATGMVTVQTHAQMLLRELDFRDGLGSRAFNQALAYAVHLIKTADVRAPKLAPYNFDSIEGPMSATLAALYMLDLFPHDSVVVEAMKVSLKPGDVGPIIQGLSDGLEIVDLPLVDLWIEQHRSSIEYPREEFTRRLSHVVADILALSLLMPDDLTDNTKDDLMLLYQPSWRQPRVLPSGDDWQNSVQLILHVGSAARYRDWAPKSIRIEPIINWTLKLLGHVVSDQVDKGDWVASSFRGQVVLPRVILAGEIPDEVFACLSHFSGMLMLEPQKDRRFSWILSKDSRFGNSKIQTPYPLSAEFNPFSSEKIRWQLIAKADHLELSMGWTLNKASQPPMKILTALADAIMNGRCSHPRNDKVYEPPALEFIPPGSNRWAMEPLDRGNLVVYPLYQNEELKLLALASVSDENQSLSHPTTMINRGACLACAIHNAEHTQCLYLVL